MSFQAYPTEAGQYRVKVYNTNNDRFWRYVPDLSRWIKLTNVDTSTNFIWYFAPVAGKANTFKIYPAYDNDNNLVSSTDNRQKYWGYGFAQGNECRLGEWVITRSADGNYSKIKFVETGYVLDCRDTTHNCLHFYQDQNVAAANNQRFVFQLVEKGL